MIPVLRRAQSRLLESLRGLRVGAAAKRRYRSKFSHHSNQNMEARFVNATVDSALREAITDQDVDAVRRLLATPGYRFPATPTAVFSLVAAQSVTVRHGQSAHADPPSVCRRRGRDMLLALVAACDEDALCRRTLHRNFVDLELDAPPLPPPRRRALPQMPRVLLVPGPVETVSQRDGLPPRLRNCCHRI